jgi:DNA-binding winged helix-turn-helix (wHTH) protein
MAAMRDETAPPRVVRFGDIELRAASGELLRPDRRVVLPEQPLRILLRLIERPGDVVSREELRRELWSDETFVDFEHGLNAAIKRLRDALGDTAESPRYIETIPRRGYRFVAPVEAVGAEAAARGPQAAWARSTRPALAVLLLAVGLAVWFGWRMSGRSSHSGTPSGEPAVHPHRVLVTYRSASGEGPLSALARVAADRLIAAMSPLDAEVLADAVGAPSTDAAVEAANAARAGLIVDVVTETLASRPHLQARLLDARSREVLFFLPKVPAPLDAADQAIGPMVQAMAGAIGIHLDHAFGGLRITSQPPGLDAYLAYRAGRNLLDRDTAGAAVLLERAAKMAPGFLLARVLLVMAYDNSGDKEKLDAEMSALARFDRLTRAERLLVEYLTESLGRRHASALRALLELERLSPGSWIVNYGIQQEALVLNRPRLVVEAFARLPLEDHAGRSNGWRLGILSRALHLLGEFERERLESRRAREYEPGNLVYLADEVRSLAALGEVAALNRVIDEGLATPPTFGRPMIVIERAVRELRVHGREADARAAARRGLEWLRSRPALESADEEFRADLARLLYLGEHWDEAVGELTRLEKVQPASIEYAGLLGAIFAGRADHARALAYDERLRQLAASDRHGREAYWRACIAALLGDAERAVNLLRSAFAAGHFRGLDIHQSYELQRLRNFPPFVALVTPEGADAPAPAR